LSSQPFPAATLNVNGKLNNFLVRGDAAAFATGQRSFRLIDRR
jgi:hypothetical protein